MRWRSLFEARPAWAVCAAVIAVVGNGAGAYAAPNDDLTGVVAARRVSLGEVLGEARRRGPGVREQEAAWRAAEGRAFQAEGTFDTRVGASVNARYSKTPAVAASDLLGGFDRRLGASVQATRSLETGGSVALVVGETRTETNVQTQGGTAGETTLTFDTSAMLTFNQSLLRGAGPRVARANVANAEALARAANQSFRRQQLETARSAAVAYWELVFAQEDLAIREAATALAAEQLVRSRELVRAGRSAEGELAALERALRARQAEEITGRALLRTRAVQLARWMGWAPDEALAANLLADISFAPTPKVPPSAPLVERALQVHPALEQTRAELRSAEATAIASESAGLPRLDLVASLGARGRDLGIGASVTQALGARAPAWGVGVEFEVPLENRVGRGAAIDARETCAALRARLRDEENIVREAVVSALIEQRAAVERVRLAAEADKFAKDNLALEIEKAAAGRSSINDVILRQQELRETQTLYARARADAMQARASLDAAVGSERMEDVLR